MNKNQNTVDVSKTMYAAKALAILFVVTAHMNMKALNPVALAVKGRLGAMGVPVFLIISAYYFKPEKYSRIRDFMKRKVISIILPWLFWGSVVYSLALWRGNGYSFFSHMNFLLGNGSYLYYMNVLMICYLCFFYPAKNHWRHVITCLCAVSVFSCFLTLTGILKPVIIMLGITDYLNPFNWFVFFFFRAEIKAYFNGEAFGKEEVDSPIHYGYLVYPFCSGILCGNRWIWIFFQAWHINGTPQYRCSALYFVFRQDSEQDYGGGRETVFQYLSDSLSCHTGYRKICEFTGYVYADQPNHHIDYMYCYHKSR